MHKDDNTNNKTFAIWLNKPIKDGHEKNGIQKINT